MIRANIRQFFKNKRGNVAMMFGLALPILLLAVAMAIEIAMFARSKHDAQTVLDAALFAAVSVARENPDATYDKEFAKAAKKKFNALYKANSDVQKLAVEFERSRDTIQANGRSVAGQTIKGKFKGSYTPHIVGAVGLGGWNFTAYDSIFIPPDPSFEIALVLDITTSMWGAKAESLKKAATDFVNILSGRDKIRGNSWIGLVPYSQSVNIGSLVKRVSSTYKAKDGSIQQVDGADFAAHPLHRRQNVVERAGMAATSDAKPTGANRYQVADDSKAFKRKHMQKPTMRIVRPTNQKAPLLDAIRSISVEGNTAGHMGFQWGLNMVSPEWKDIWNAPGGTSPYSGTGAKDKYIVMMTDGEFQYSPGLGSKTGPGTGSWSNVNPTFLELCIFARAQGITVFTVAFKAPAEAEKVMRQCSPMNFVDAKSDEALQATFRNIAHTILSTFLSG